MKPIEMDKLTQIVNDATTTNNNCDKCLWGDDECHKIDCWCPIATTLRLLAEGGYLEIAQRKKKGGKE